MKSRQQCLSIGHHYHPYPIERMAICCQCGHRVVGTVPVSVDPRPCGPCTPATVLVTDSSTGPTSLFGLLAWAVFFVALAWFGA